MPHDGRAGRRATACPYSINVACTLTGVTVALLLACANAAGANAGDLVDLSLEELASIRVTSVSKKSERLADAPAAIFVITRDNIRRAGVTTLPEALRLAPNLQVARADARNYAVTARGLNSPFANKLLVMIDGRTVYTPLFSGVFWDAQDVVLEDIDRIEVISGPGATLWGANAVNGVINIITRPAAETQGDLVAIGGGRREKEGAVRHGGVLENGGHYRVYGKYVDMDDSRSQSGAVLPTGMHRQQAGFRTDWGAPGNGTTVHGDAYSGALHQQGTTGIDIGGANLVGRAERRLGADSTLSAQAYWDYTERSQPNGFVEHLHTLDVQLQHSVKPARAHDIVWGAGYRLALDRVRNGTAYAFLPGKLNLHWANIFAQDEITLADTLRLTTGLKLERNTYTGLEYLPTVRLAWKPQEETLVWGSASRAVRTPSRIDRDFYSPTSPPLVNGIPRFDYNGGPRFNAEIAKILELGYRAQPAAALSYSVTLFCGRYDGLRTLEPVPADAGSGVAFENGAEGYSRGAELWGNWQASAAVRFAAGLVTQRIHTARRPGSLDSIGNTGLATSDPSHYWSLRASWDIAPGHELDATLRGVGELAHPAVPAYTSLDLRYGWQIRRNLELSLVGQNLLDSIHPEFGGAPARSVSERAAYVKLLWRL